MSLLETFFAWYKNDYGSIALSLMGASGLLWPFPCSTALLIIVLNCCEAYLGWPA